MKIHSVTTTRDLEEFIQLPYRLYRDDPMWVAPLRNELRGQFNPQKNPL